MIWHWWDIQKIFSHYKLSQLFQRDCETNHVLVLSVLLVNEGGDQLGSFNM